MQSHPLGMLTAALMMSGTAICAAAQTAPPIKPGLWQVQTDREVDGQKVPDPADQDGDDDEAPGPAPHLADDDDGQVAGRGLRGPEADPAAGEKVKPRRADIGGPHRISCPAGLRNTARAI